MIANRILHCIGCGKPSGLLLYDIPCCVECGKEPEIVAFIVSRDIAIHDKKQVDNVDIKSPELYRRPEPPMERCYYPDGKVSSERPAFPPQSPSALVHIHEDLWVDAALVVSVSVSDGKGVISRGNELGPFIAFSWTDNNSPRLRYFDFPTLAAAQQLAREIVERVNQGRSGMAVKWNGAQAEKEQLHQAALEATGHPNRCWYCNAIDGARHEPDCAVLAAKQKEQSFFSNNTWTWEPHTTEELRVILATGAIPRGRIVAKPSPGDRRPDVYMSDSLKKTIEAQATCTCNASDMLALGWVCTCGAKDNST